MSILALRSSTVRYANPINRLSFHPSKKSSLFPRMYTSSSNSQIPNKIRNWARFGVGFIIGFALVKAYAFSNEKVAKPAHSKLFSYPAGKDHFQIAVDYEMKDEEVSVISKGLAEFNTPFFGQIKSTSFAIYLRDEDGEVVGGVTAWMRPGIGLLCIDTIALPEHLRRQGYGTKLLLAAEEEGRKHGCTHAQLETLPFQAEDFYKKLGYVRIGHVEKLYGPYDAYYMRKTLKEPSQK